jgi:predicted deacylase
MTKMNIGTFLTYPVFRLGDSPFTRKLQRLHTVLVRATKISTIALPALTGLYLLAGFYLPASVTFSTSDSSCAFAPAIVPGFLSYQPKEFYNVTTPPRLAILGKTILSTHMCVIPTSVPSGGETKLRVKQFGLPIEKTLTVKNSSNLYASPKLTSNEISTRNNLVFKLSEPDMFFDYLLVVGNKSVGCRTQTDTVVCPTKELDLMQGEPYTFSLKQTLGGTSQSLFSEEYVTITSVEIVESSIPDASTVYDQPLSLLLTTSKPLKKLGQTTFSDGITNLSAVVSTTDTGLSITWDTPLERNKTYTITIETVEATDGGHLEKPYTLTFTTSGGPKVTNSTLPSVRTSQSPDFTLTFDQPLKGDQDFNQIVSLVSGGVAVPLTITANGSELRVRVKSAITSCSEYVVAIRETLTSIHGISGNNAYSSTHRSQCAREFSIGTSVEGRSIVGYALGNGPKKIVFLGAIHGNEKSTYFLLDGWINYLEANPSQIPSDKTVIVLPRLNPDGFLRGSRFNARNVDLNRNFASANWKTDVVVPGGSAKAGAGGTAPLSEPESKALIDYLQSISPTLVMSYHSQGSITIPNGSGNSNALALDYARAVDYQYISAEDSAGAFEHETTGALEDWLQEVPGIPVVLNELSSHGATGLFQFHRDPMLTIIKK